MFSGVSLSDRLKAAVNQLEQTGTSLQARAISAANSAHAPADAAASTSSAAKPVVSVPSRPSTPGTKVDASSPPSRSQSTANLADSALAGLRRSLQQQRASMDTSRPSSDQLNAASTASNGKTGSSPTSPTKEVGPPSRATSPSRFLSAATFSLGSLHSSAAASAKDTPQQQSPKPDTSTAELPAIAAVELPTIPAVVPERDPSWPPLDPERPETYPLPPSPTLEPAIVLSGPLSSEPLETTDEEPQTLDLTSASNADTAPSTEDHTPTATEGGEATETASSPIAADVTDVTDGANSPASDADTKRLEDAERRFEDLSKRYTLLLTQVHAANSLFKELTPLEGGIADADALEGWVRMVNGKVEMSGEELKRMQGKLDLQESRMQELRDTHRLEGGSQTDLITKLRGDLSKAQTQIKEEEEKRTKAIQLLKTVRQKLVKVEKEKELVEKDRAEERAERSRAGEEIEKVKAEREREVTKLGKSFEKELAAAKERAEKDMAAKKASWELDMITTKAGHAKELTNKTSRITALETQVKDLQATKSSQFETIQARQAEAEGALSEMEGLQTRTKELEFQLREANERIALLEDASASSRDKLSLSNGGSVSRSSSPSRNNSGTSAAEVQRLLAEADAKSEAKLSDLRFKVRALERERNELEEDWASKLSQRVKDLENLRRTIADKEAEVATASAARQERDARLEQQEANKRDLEREMVELRGAVEEARADVAVALEAEKAAREELATAQNATSAVQHQLDEAKAKETQLRNNNKTLRDELRKVQSGVQLMERQRGRGVGYWADGSGPAGPGSGSGVGAGVGGASSPPVPSPTQSPAPGGIPSRTISTTSLASANPENTSGNAGTSRATPTEKKAEEEVNLEYLRNVILQFLEHREMRANLVRVLSVILRFTPQELRRLEAKLNT